MGPSKPILLQLLRFLCRLVYYLLHLRAYFTTIQRIAIVDTKYFSFDWGRVVNAGL